VLVGAGGFGREVAEAVRAVNAERPTWSLLGFLDDAASLQGEEVDGTPVVGRIDDARGLDADVLVCTGRPDNYFSRQRIVERLALPADRYATIVHPQASVASTATIGRGTALLAYTVVTARAQIGSHVAVMPAVVITHDDVIEDYVTIGAGARFGGGARVREGAYIGSGAMVRENTTIGRWSQLGMGAVATRDVPDAEVWVGVPAARLRRVRLPEAVSA